jgi:hypothetical protein
VTSRFYLTEADMKFCGIDLHSNNSVVVVSDAEDRIVLQRRLRMISMQSSLPLHFTVASSRVWSWN